VFQNRVLRKIFGSKSDEITVEWRRLHDEELHDLYSLNIIGVIKYRRMRLTGYVAWEKAGSYTSFRWRDLGERDRLEDLVLDGMIILK